jgi:hypothetical protein
MLRNVAPSRATATGTENQSVRTTETKGFILSNDTAENAVGSKIDRFASTLTRVLGHDMEEDTILLHMGEFFNPQPANLFSSDKEKDALQWSVDQLMRRFTPEVSNPPLVVLPFDADPKTGKVKLKTYHISLVNEWFSYFYKCRRSVCRAHMYYITCGALDKYPEFWPDMPHEERKNRRDLMERRFYDALEIATTRLSSYWDRVGQLFDFVFFNIRQYERDVFPSVLDRIKKNFVPTCPEIANSSAWDSITKYANSEKRDGYKWLARRRNLIVHSMQMAPKRQSDDTDAIFEYEFNHYEHRVISDLAIKEPEEELADIHSHLASAALLVPFVIELVRLGLDAVDR